MSLSIIKKIIVFFLVLVLATVNLFAFDRYTWDECLQITEKNHPDLQQAKTNINQAKADKDAAISGYLPQISLAGSVERGNSSSTGTASSDTQATNTYSYSISGNQVLFDGLNTFYAMKSTKSLFDEARYQYLSTSSTLRYKLRLAFIMLLRAQEALSLVDDIVAIRKKNIEFVSMRYKAGREHIGSVLNSRANFLQAQLEQTQAKRDHILF